MKIAVVGYAVEGKSGLEYLRRQYPEAEFTVVDQAEVVEVVAVAVEDLKKLQH